MKLAYSISLFAHYFLVFSCLNVRLRRHILFLNKCYHTIYTKPYSRITRIWQYTTLLFIATRICIQKQKEWAQHGHPSSRLANLTLFTPTVSWQKKRNTTANLTNKSITDRQTFITFTPRCYKVKLSKWACILSFVKPAILCTHCPKCS